MNYLKYIEQSAENLQFFLWLRSYTQKFNELPESERGLSPEWTMTIHEAEQAAAQPENRKMKVSADTAAILKDTGFDTTVTETEKDPFNTPPRTPSSDTRPEHNAASEISSLDDKSTWSSGQRTADVRRKAGDTYEEAGLNWQPCELPPIRGVAVSLLITRSHNPAFPR